MQPNKIVTLLFLSFMLTGKLYAQPGIPGNFEALKGPKQIRLQWNAVTGSNMYYKVFRGTTAQNMLLHQDSVTNTFFLDESATPYTNYFYAVAAFNQSGVGSNTAAIMQSSNRIFYVDPTGNNNNFAGEAAPVATIMSAVIRSVTGDTILLNSGTYNERLNLVGRALTIVSRYIFTGNPAFISNTIINGSTQTLNDPLIFDNNNNGGGTKNFIGFTITGSRNAAIDVVSTHLKNLRITNCYTQPFTSRNFLITLNFSNCSIDSCEIFNNNTQAAYYFIFHYGSSDFNFTNNRIENNRFGNFILHTSEVNAPATRRIINNRFINNFSTEASLTVINNGALGGTAFQRAIIANNLIAKNMGTAIGLSPRLGDSLFIINNTITRNWNGLSLNSDDGRFTKIQNNIFYDNYFIWGQNQQELYVGAGSQGIPPPTQRVQFNNNLIGRQDTANPLNYIQLLHYVDTTGSTNNFGGDPGFVDTAANDFRLAKTSVCINAGASHYYMPSSDLAGLQRPSPLGSNPDIGCFENPAKFASPIIYASEAGNQSMMIYWRPSKSNGFTKQRVYRSTSPIPDTTLVNFLMQTTATTTQLLDVSQLTNLTTYYYRIRVGDDLGNWSELSNEWTANPRVPPSNPTDFLATKGPRRIVLNWQASVGTGVRYVIFRDTIQNQRRMILDTITATSFIDSSVVPFKLYYYTIHPIDVFNTKGSFVQTSGFANRIWYVSTAGNNSNRGLESSPYNSLNFAYARAHEEDTILVEPGTYFIEELLLNTKRLTFASRYLFDRNPNHISNTIINGSSQSQLTSSLIRDLSNGDTHGSTKIHRFIGFTITKSKGMLMYLSNVHLQNLIIEDNNTQGVTGVTTLLGFSGEITVDSCIVRNNLVPTYYLIGSGVGFYNSNIKFTNNIIENNKYETVCFFIGPPGNTNVKMNFEMRSNKIQNNIPTGAINTVFHYNAPGPYQSKLTITNNLIANHNSRAVSFTQSAEDSIFIDHNTITQNLWGLGLHADLGKYASITNNIIAFNGNQSATNLEVWGTPISPKPKAIFRNNLIGNTTVTNALSHIINVHYLDTIGSLNNISGIPYFKDSAAKDFTLSNISLAIGKGAVTNTTPAFDLNNNPRPMPIGSNPDLGAFESVQSVIAPRLDSISTQNATVRMVWFADTANSKQYDIYSGTSPNNLSLLTRIFNNQVRAHVDSFPILQTRNYYAIYAISKNNDTSGISNIIHAVPLVNPTLVNPSENQTKVARTFNFIWDRNTEAVNYRFQLARNRNFTTLINKDTITADTFYRQTINLLFNTKYYWRVRANNSTGFSIWQTDSFQTLVRQPLIDSLNSRFERVWIRWNDGLSTGIYKYVVTRINTNNNDIKIDTVNAGTYTHLDSTITTGIRYHYRVQAMNNDSVLSEYSNSRFVIPLSAPLLAEPTNNSISPSRTPTLTWEKYPFATSYRIQASLSQNFSSLDVDTIRPDTFFRYHKLMLPNAYYYWRVQSRDSLGFSNFSAANGFQTELSVPNLHSLTTNNNVIRLNWFDTAASSVASYQIFRSTSQGASILIATVPGGNFVYYDSAALNGTQYFYRIKSVSNQQLTSNFSRELTGVPFSLVSGFTATRGPWRVNLTWNANSQPNIMYEIYRKKGSLNFELLVDSLLSNEFLDLNVDAGNIYSYQIRTKDIFNNASEFSNQSVATPNQIWYVDTAGSNTNWGAEVSKLKTITQAIQLANISDTIVLARGTYNERIQIAGKELTIASEFILDGMQNKIDSTFISGLNLGTLPLVSDNQNKRFRLIGLHLTNANQIAITSNTNAQHAVTIRNSIISNSGNTFTNGVINISNGILQSTVIRNCSANVLINAGNHILNTRLHFEQNRLHHNVSSGSILHANFATAINNLFYSNAALAVVVNNINADANDSALILVNNTIANNVGTGLQIGGTPIIIADNNIVNNNTTAQIAYIGQSGLAILRMRNNIIRGYDTVNVPSTFTRFSTNNLDTTVTFRNLANNDYSLANFSIGLGLGSNHFNNTKDINNNSRPLPVGSNPDIGAFENNNAFPGPVLINVTASPTGIVLNWGGNNTNVNGYKIYRGTDANNLTLLTSVSGSTFTYNDNTAANQTFYYYAVRSTVGQNTESGLSNILNAIILNPIVLIEPNNNEDSVLLTTKFIWNKQAIATAYRIQLSLNTNFNTTLIDTTVNDTLINYGVLLNNTTYYWRVRGITANGIGNWSSTRQFETVVKTPTILSVTTADKLATITWSDNNAANINRYIIYRGLNRNNLTVLTTVNSGTYTFTDNNLTNDTRYYYSIAAINNNESGSLPSDTVEALPLEKPNLLLPLNPSVFAQINGTKFYWNSSVHQVNSQLQLSKSAQFNTIEKDTLVPDTSAQVFGLDYNTNYWWRVRFVNSTGASNWSNPFRVQTQFQNCVIDSIVAGNKRNTIYWSHPNNTGIKAYRIQRSNDQPFTNPIIVTDVQGGNVFSYTDIGLQNGQTYYYFVYPINFDDILGSASNMENGTPFNTKPVAAKLADVYLNNQRRKIENNHTFSSIGSTDEDGQIDSTVWYVNGVRVFSGANLNYPFRQGTSLITLKVYDNDIAVDTSFAYIHVNTFVKTMLGPILGGLSAAAENIIYASDGTNKMIQLDSLGSEKFSLSVDNNITTTPSISNDTSVLITNASSLNGFNKFGSALFNSIPLGGSAVVTPTVDSTLKRVYIGLSGSNRSLVAINYATGGQEAWRFLCDAEIRSSAVITLDRKLIFPDAAGNLYGFDISTANSHGSPAQPFWKYKVNDSFNTSPAIDTAGHIYVGSNSGKVFRLRFNSNGTVDEIWNVTLGSKTTSSPVIDADGFVYIGCENGLFYKLNPGNGNTIWVRNTGAAIKSTPAISKFGDIYVANESGLLLALNPAGETFWYYKDTTAVNANILHVNGTTYIGTLGGRVLAFWDVDLTTLGKKGKPEKDPIWGTFQGNVRRTGSQNPTPNLPTVGIGRKVTSNNSINVYPNPANNNITITAENQEITTITVIDLKGSELKRIDGINAISHQLLVSDLPTGIYVIGVKTSNGQMQVKLQISR